MPGFQSRAARSIPGRCFIGSGAAPVLSARSANTPVYVEQRGADLIVQRSAATQVHALLRARSSARGHLRGVS